jgi:hypothetical protein
LNYGFHNIWQVFWLDASHVFADVEADNGLVARDAVHHAGHLRVDQVLAQVQPGNQSETYSNLAKNKLLDAILKSEEIKIKVDPSIKRTPRNSIC